MTQPDDFRGPTACAVAGIGYRQLDYWARAGLVEPSIRSASGSGSQRLYSRHDLVLLTIVRRLLDCGISMQQVRLAVKRLGEPVESDLTSITLVSDGVAVDLCTSPRQIEDLVQSGRAVYGIAVGRVIAEVDEHIAVLGAAV